MARGPQRCSSSSGPGSLCPSPWPLASPAMTPGPGEREPPLPPPLASILWELSRCIQSTGPKTLADRPPHPPWGPGGPLGLPSPAETLPCKAGFKAVNAHHFAQISVTFNVSVCLVSQMDLRALASQTGISSGARGPVALVLTAACRAVAGQGEDVATALGWPEPQAPPEGRQSRAARQRAHRPLSEPSP